MPSPGRAFAVVVGLLAWTGLPTVAVAAAAQPDGAVLSEADAAFELTAPVTLNGVYLGDADVRVTVTGEGTADAERLLRLTEGALSADGLALIAGASEGGRLPLDALADGPLRVGFDVALVELSVTAPSDLLAARAVALRRTSTPDPDGFVTSSGLSGAVAVELAQQWRGTGGAGDPRDGFGEVAARLNAFANLGGQPGLSVFAELEADETDGLVRRDVSLLRDDPERALRALAGDVVPLSTGLQGSVPILGLQVARRWGDIQPFRNVYAAGRQSLLLEAPSRVEVFVNGEVTSVLDLPAGPVTITDFPFAAGANEVELLITDPLGVQDRVAFSFYAQGQVLTQGLTDFSAALGTERRQTRRGYAYGGGLVATGYLNHGVTNGLTLGVNGQATGQTVQLGAEAAFATRYGYVLAQAAGSRLDPEAAPRPDDGGWGAAGSVLHAAQLPIGEAVLSATNALTLYSDGFATVAGRTDAAPSLAYRGTLRAQAGRTNVTLDGSVLRFRGDRPDTVRAGLSVSRPVGRFTGRLGAEYLRRGGDEEVALTAGLALNLGGRGYARARATTRGDAASFEAGRTALAVPTSLGGNVRYATSNRAEEVTARASLVHDRFIADLDGAHVEASAPPAAPGTLPAAAPPPRTTARWRVGSMIGYADGVVGVGRPSDVGFVLVRRHETLDEAGVALTRQGGGGAEAKADRFGAGLVPILRAYTPRRLEVRVDPLPVGYDLGSGEVALLPTPGTGYAVTVGSDASRTVLGIATSADGAPVARVVGTLVPLEDGVPDEAPDAARQVFTNAAGRFVAERVASGVYVLRLGNQRSGPIEVGRDTKGAVDVGTIVMEEVGGG